MFILFKKFIFILLIILVFSIPSQANSGLKLNITNIEPIDNQYPKIKLNFDFKDRFNRSVSDLAQSQINITEEDTNIDKSNIFLYKLPAKKSNLSVAFVIDNNKILENKYKLINDWFEKLDSYLYFDDKKLFFTSSKLEPITSLKCDKKYFSNNNFRKTDFFNTLLASINFLAKSNESKRIIFLFSDGFDNTNQDIDTIINKAKGFGISIYPINFLYPSGTLKRLSQTTDGVLLSEVNNDSNTLDKIFKKIYSDMYYGHRLDFYSPLNSSKYERNLKISLNYKGKLYESEKKYIIKNASSTNKIFLWYAFILLAILTLIIAIFRKLVLKK